MQTSLPVIVKFIHTTLDLLMISIYPVLIYYVESDVLRLKPDFCGIIADTTKGNKEFKHIQKTIDQFSII